MEALIYLRDCIFDQDCDYEDNIQIDLQTRQLWFVRDDIKSQAFDLDMDTPLLSSTTNKPYTLYQLYLFNAYVKECQWADYVIDLGMAKSDPSNANHIIESIAPSANMDCDRLYDYLKGNTNIHNGLNVKTPKPKRLQIEINKHKKRKIDNIDSMAHPPNKKQKLEPNMSNQMNIMSEFDHKNNNNNNMTDSLFIENYNVNPIEIMDDSKPFWMTLPDPIPLISNNNTNINWKDEYRTRIRESNTRNTILNSLNNKSFGEIAKEFPKISRSLQKLIQNGGTKGHITRIKLNHSEKIRKLRTEIPIIIVPYSNNSLLTFSNCLPFLQENKYIPCNNKSLIINHKSNKNKSATRINLHKLSYLDPKSNKHAIFEIRSSSSFTKNTLIGEWNRIAAIFVIGKQWQFKKWISGWKEPEEIFSKAAGFYMHFKDDPPNKIVQHWRVNNLPITRNERHTDAKIAKQFWDKLIEHLKKHRNKKLFF